MEGHVKRQSPVNVGLSRPYISSKYPTAYGIVPMNNVKYDNSISGINYSGVP